MTSEDTRVMCIHGNHGEPDVIECDGKLYVPDKVCEYVPEDFDSMYDGEDRRVIVGKPSEDCTSFVCSECANYMMFDCTGEYSWFEPEYPYKPIALNHCPRCGARVLFPPSWLDMKEVEE